MTGDFESIPDIVSAAVGTTGDELTFAFPEALAVTRRCTENEIAVLGVDLFEAHPDGYATKKLSAYSHDQQTQRRLDSVLATSGWRNYVCASNALAEQFIRQNPAGDEHVYVLTTSSWREFSKLQKRKGASDAT